MGNQSSQPLSKDLECSKFIHFLPIEIREWSFAFKTIYPDGRMSLKDFIDFFSSLFPFGKVEPFCTRMFQNINISQAKEVELSELLIAFTILLKGSTFERLRWLFRFYDDDKDGFVSRDELEKGFDIINLMVSNSMMSEIPSKFLVDEIFSSLQNQSGFLTFNDFEILAQENSDNFKKISFFYD
ncbi:uncharacterized protein VICG_02132 [Vittaforma corneae ATCC 50505]|uniref:EF-hand domain-containing protein n=1 Tax=Vittaforma corneae (strain ATCC 50505) TaxID=993615 RepID=L2GKL2_VITCO|nr:uncharacterized protein VICG_02132 [Vittaforma corneae ATCC 50505]ELA40832.1 hypothetical protein VICG_02132 [Vittaforma corneae ATCC 50505]